jgi:hypothetical protein
MHQYVYIVCFLLVALSMYVLFGASARQYAQKMCSYYHGLRGMDMRGLEHTSKYKLTIYRVLQAFLCAVLILLLHLPFYHSLGPLGHTTEKQHGATGT